VIVGVVRYRQFTRNTVLAAALGVLWTGSGTAQTQEVTAHEQSPAENDSAAEASKQAANPLANVWLMQIQQNNRLQHRAGDQVPIVCQFRRYQGLKLEITLDPVSIVRGHALSSWSIARHSRTKQRYARDSLRRHTRSRSGQAGSTGTIRGALCSRRQVKIGNTGKKSQVRTTGIEMKMVARRLRELVDLVGIEPTTSSMPWKRAPSCATGPLG
jgi:hypothetical protein